MSKKQKPQKLKGFQDIHGATMLIKENLSEQIKQKAKLANFESVDTPCLEYTETLLGEGGDTDKQIFRFEDNGGRDISLRYDLTMSFARFVSEHNGKLQLPYKRFQIGKAWRAEKPQKGRFREFTQCDFDIIGVNNAWADAEIISLIYGVFSDAIKLPFTMSIGYRQIVSAVISKIYGKLESSDEQRILINLDKLAKIGKDKVCALIVSETKTSSDKVELLLKILISKEDYKKQIKSLRVFLGGDEFSESHLTRLEKTFDVLTKVLDLSTGTLKLDFSLVRGLAYYTGIVFETVLDDFEDYGSVGSGGRYDNLCDRFMRESLSGIGGSVGLDRIVAALSSQDKKEVSYKKETVMVAVANEEARDYAFEVLKVLRDKGLSSEIYLKEQKLSNQFKFASKMGYSSVVTIGEEEKKNRTVNLKDMLQGKELKDVNLDDLFDHLEILD